MVSSSSSDDEIDPRTAKGTQSTMKSLFASDARSALRGSTTLRYEAKSKRDEVSASGAAAAAVGAQPPSAAGSAAASTVTAAQATVQAFRGDQPSGPAAVAAVVVNGVPMVILIDRERRPLCRVRCNADLQLLQNQSSPQYATLYDPAIGQHWTLMFRTPADCTNFVTATSTLLHYILASDGPQEPFLDIIAPTDGARAVRKGDRVTASMTVWIVQRVGGGTFFTIGKIVEEVPTDAPCIIDVGQGMRMVGVEEALIGMTPGAKRLAFIGPRKTKMSGIGNPEIGTSDSVVVLITCHSCERGGGGGGGGGLSGMMGDSADDSDSDVISAAKKRKPSKQSTALQPIAKEPLPVAAAPPVAPTPQPPQAQASPTTVGGIDQNTLIQTMLLQTLQLQQQQQQQQKSVSAEPSRPSPAMYDVDQGLNRLYQQLFALSAKIDRIDVESKIAKNNEVIERIVKKAVGKMPVNDVDIEDMAKDRDQLLAKIEHMKQRLEEAQDSYHRALETMSTHKDQLSAVKNDLLIERETSSARIKELTERKRLELVDLEVKHRRELDRVREQSLQEGMEKGYEKGFAAGRVDALTIAGSSSTEDLRHKLHEAEQALVEAESRYQQQASKNYQERREMLDQVASLNSLIKRLESREAGKAQTVVDTSSAMCKTLRRAMNSTYASIEAQFYATERDTISVEDALAMVLISIKSETRSYVEEIKREGALIVASSTASRDDGGAEMPPSSRDEAVAAYVAGAGAPTGSAAYTAADTPSTAASDAYLEMRAEIEAYQRQRDQEAAAAEVASASGGFSVAEVKAPPPPPSDFDVGSLPLPPLNDMDDENERRADQPPPPPPAVLFSSQRYYDEPPRDDLVEPPPRVANRDDPSGEDLEWDNAS